MRSRFLTEDDVLSRVFFEEEVVLKFHFDSEDPYVLTSLLRYFVCPVLKVFLRLPVGDFFLEKENWLSARSKGGTASDYFTNVDLGTYFKMEMLKSSSSDALFELMLLFELVGSLFRYLIGTKDLGEPQPQEFLVSSFEEWDLVSILTCYEKLSRTWFSSNLAPCSLESSLQISEVLLDIILWFS